MSAVTTATFRPSEGSEVVVDTRSLKLFLGIFNTPLLRISSRNPLAVVVMQVSERFLALLTSQLAQFVDCPEVRSLVVY